MQSQYSEVPRARFHVRLTNHKLQCRHSVLMPAVRMTVWCAGQPVRGEWVAAPVQCDAVPALAQALAAMPAAVHPPPARRDGLCRRPSLGHGAPSHQCLQASHMPSLINLTR